jgi:hypothetical protein
MINEIVAMGNGLTIQSSSFTILVYGRYRLILL